jgi:hypothetical protein
VRCPSCSSAVTDGRRFCPSCGTPVAAATAARVGAAASPAAAARPQSSTAGTPTGTPLGTPTATPAGTASGNAPAAATAAMPAVPYPDEPVADTQRTAHLVTPADAGADPRGRAGATLERAGDALRRSASRAADRFGAAPVEVRAALVGTAVVLLAFVLLPYGADGRTAAAVGGRLWWRPVAAVVATFLLATTLRHRTTAPDDAGTGTTGRTDGTDRTDRTGGTADRLLAALVVATIGATEAGLVGLFSGDTGRTRAGYYVILAGLVTVLVATTRAARRRCRT